MKLRRWLMMVLLAGAALASVLYHRANVPELAVLEGQTMGTYYRIKVAGESSENLKSLKPSVEAALKRINKSLSTWDADSLISRFNADKDNLDSFLMEGDFFPVMHESRHMSLVSDGAFNPALAPLIKLWGFDRDSDQQKWPEPEEVAEALALSDFDQGIRLVKEVMLRQKAGVTLNFSAIAKGYAVDVLGEALKKAGHLDYLVDIGGEILARGLNTDGTAWRVGIEQPDQNGAIVQTVVALEDEAIATSGDYRNYREKDGKRFSHIIDPRTGYPIDHDIASVSVRAETAMRADGFATALMVMGRAGLETCEKQELACYLIVRENGVFSSLSSSRW